MYSIRILTAQPLRLTLTVAGIALCIVLMLFLLGIHRGVFIGSVEYIQKNLADLWVVQENTTNILRGFSLLRTGHGDLLKTIDGVTQVAPVLFLLCAVEREGRRATVYLTGYDPALGKGGPPALNQGHNVRNDDEIVLDKSFAAKQGIGVGDRVTLRGESLVVVGLSSGTNAFVIQYAFVTISRAQKLSGFPSLVSCFLVTSSIPKAELRTRIREDVPGVDIYTQEEFMANNIREMESGLLPLLFTIAAIGGLVLVAILTLLLTINILERRTDIAVMKALGVPDSSLTRLVLALAFLISGAGTALALATFFPLAFTIECLAPEVTTSTSSLHIILAITMVAAISVFSALVAARRTHRIYPLEAFQ
jgi:ABC-type antimicrobial peptide transport system permease subunit